ncbi:P-loop containing nucleoside triphosphate hydrolase protein [Basidiobolus meristosporus CBS 931.73]|uniref:p-loop containing nucleoside triphosphate hydrolase protein n=1 Tax=Basidiobolus meristosporus CBS 931.73 TaxID=1314790 RepID=A0A1Y1X1S8_9FUNG|nr:P-loop containing nucleoside triphosphate hydrolase protein [Basidiobolus meristosporus CBS 931.73]|eukprot:ORX79615.1 P-loop containing nucleoside triphosphate hydrolase protein [Basidiobolus meristosporus CBS 931.73]
MSPASPQLPKSDEPSITRTLCQRCFNIVHYNKEPAIWGENAVTDRSYLRFLKKKHNAIVVKVFDIFDFPGSFLEDLEDFTSNVKHVILVANKIDLLPGDVNRNRVIDWLRRRSKSMGLTNVSSVHLVSAKKNHGIRELANTIANLRDPQDDVYLVGCTNVGKSEIINSLMRVCKGRIHKKNKVTSSLLPGTTIGMLGIPLQRFGHAFGKLEHNEIDNPKQFLYDTPGILNKEQLIHFLNHSELRYVIPNKPMKPETFMMTPGRSLLLGGLGRLDYTEGQDEILVTVFSQVLPHFTKIEKADILCDRLASGESTILCPPIGDAERLKRFPRLVEGAEFTLSGSHRTMATMDIVLTSVGWFSITGLFDRARLKVYSPGGIGIRTREPLLPFEFRGQISKYRSNTRKIR